MSENRIKWIDYMKGFSMIGIILFHLNGPYTICRFIYPFMLVSFFFVAGYTFNRYESFSSFIRKKFKALIIPIVCFGIFNTIIAHIFEAKPLTDRLLYISFQIPGKWDDLWFIGCLFSMELLFYTIVSLSNKVKTQCILSSLCVISGVMYTMFVDIRLPWHLENALILIWAMYLGYLLHQTPYGLHFINTLRDNKNYAFAILIVMVYLFLIYGYNNYPIDIHLLDYGNIGIFLLSAIIGTIVVLFISIQLEKIPTDLLKWLSFLGQNTLAYYALQPKFIRLAGLVFNSWGVYSSTYIGCIIHLTFVCISIIPIIILINRYLPFFVGKKRKKIRI